MKLLIILAVIAVAAAKPAPEKRGLYNFANLLGGLPVVGGELRPFGHPLDEATQDINRPQEPALPRIPRIPRLRPGSLAQSTVRDVTGMLGGLTADVPFAGASVGHAGNAVNNILGSSTLGRTAGAITGGASGIIGEIPVAGEMIGATSDPVFDTVAQQVGMVPMRDINGIVRSVGLPRLDDTRFMLRILDALL